MQSWPKHEFSANRGLSPRQIDDPKRDEWFSIFLEVFLCEMGNTVRCWPRYQPDRPHRGRGGARLDQAGLVSSAEQLRFSEPEKRLDTLYLSNGSFYLKMQREIERGSKFNFLSMSEFPLTKRCLPPPRLAAEVGLSGGLARRGCHRHSLHCPQPNLKCVQQ